jgi:hypothetical protein
MTDQISRQRRKPICLPLGEAIFDCYVLALDKAGLTQTFAKRRQDICGWFPQTTKKITYHRQRALLGPHRNRPRSGRAPKKSEDHSPPYARHWLPPATQETTGC